VSVSALRPSGATQGATRTSAADLANLRLNLRGRYLAACGSALSSIKTSFPGTCFAQTQPFSFRSMSGTSGPIGSGPRNWSGQVPVAGAAESLSVASSTGPSTVVLSMTTGPLTVTSQVVPSPFVSASTTPPTTGP
jgi:hypothetical protein